MKNKHIKNLVLAAMFLAIGLVLPLLTGQIPQVGKMLLPMHIPVLLCGLICGWQYGLCIGFILPLLRTMIFGMPVLFPTAVSMAFELAAYGFIIGFLYSHARWHCVISLYRCLILAMAGGRIVLGIANALLFWMSGSIYTFKAFMAAAVTTAIPGIIVQLILIPAIMIALDRTGIVRFSSKHHAKKAAENV